MPASILTRSLESYPTPDSSDSRTPSYAVLRPDDQPADTRRPFLHQVEAQEKLSQAFNEWKLTGCLQGFVVMPTGSGKTYTMVTWQVKNLIDRGYRVVWIAPNDLLFEQAARAFYHAAGLARSRPQLAIRIVSARHCSVDDIQQGDDVIIVSAAMLLRHRTKFLRLLADPRVFVILDEAHHAPAMTYRLLLKNLPAKRQLIGLTATPTRTEPTERPLLARLFGGRIMYQAEADALIERGILARPILVRVNAQIDVDRVIGANDIEHLARAGDLSREALDRISKIEQRNQVIVDHYLASAHRYGKTLIFAGNVRHAALLADRLRASGVRAEYVAGRRYDKQDNRHILDRFRDPQGDIDVVTCVLKLSEGVDLPRTQTVILASPTASEIRMRQMIGRALRGPAVGGTTIAHLVAFLDEGKHLADWRDPFHLVPDLVQADQTHDHRHVRPSVQEPTWAETRDVARHMRNHAPISRIDAYEAVPSRWYVVKIEGQEGAGRLVVAYSNQAAGWDATVKYLKQADETALAALDGNALLERFFPRMTWPGPRVQDLDDLVKHVRVCGCPPSVYGAEGRWACAPEVLARQIVAGYLGERARRAWLDTWESVLAER